eukprot:2886388-Alexandrium_andersonii.AAC.1
MSASLVGSEMCIRDRHRDAETQQRRGTETQRQEDTETHRDTQRHTEAHRDTPVSYTHLTLPTICSV